MVPKDCQGLLAVTRRQGRGVAQTLPPSPAKEPNLLTP